MPKQNRRKMTNTIYKLSLIGIIIFGGFMAFFSYNADIYPLDRIQGHLDGVVDSSDPVILRTHLLAIQTNLDFVMEKIPETTDVHGIVISKNPVWLFSTESTNFLRIQNDINTMITNVEEIVYVQKDTSAYYTGMLDINDRAELIKINVMDATPYMYVTPGFILSNSFLLIGIFGITDIIIRKSPNIR